MKKELNRGLGQVGQKKAMTEVGIARSQLQITSPLEHPILPELGKPSNLLTVLPPNCAANHPSQIPICGWKYGSNQRGPQRQDPER